MNEHEAVVDELVALGGVRIHHIQLSPQIVPVLSPAIAGFQPTNNSSVRISLPICTGTLSRYLAMMARMSEIVSIIVQSVQSANMRNRRR